MTQQDEDEANDTPLVTAGRDDRSHYERHVSECALSSICASVCAASSVLVSGFEW